MWRSDRWKDYELIDCSRGEKLERWGDQLLVRPDPQAIWNTPRTHRGWKHNAGRYARSSSGGGQWQNKSMPERWTVSYGSLTFNIKPMNFKHTGLFPEQAANWDWAQEQIRSAGRPINVLNLFAYTGGATVACAAAGASVGQGERQVLPPGGRPHPLDRGRLRQVRGAGDPPGTEVRRHYHGPAQLRPGPLRGGVAAGGEPVPLCGAGLRGAVRRAPVSPCSLS